MEIEPDVGCSKPAMRRRQVVLPEPDGPSMAKNSPAPMSRSTASTARTEPKWRETCLKETAGVMVPVPGSKPAQPAAARPPSPTGEEGAEFAAPVGMKINPTRRCMMAPPRGKHEKEGSGLLYRPPMT